MKRCGCPGGRDSRDGELCSDSGCVSEGQLSVLAGSLGVRGRATRKIKNDTRLRLWPEPQVGLFIETGWIGP